MQSPSIDRLKSDLHITFFSLSYYWEILIFWGKNPATHVYFNVDIHQLIKQCIMIKFILTVCPQIKTFAFPLHMSRKCKHKTNTARFFLCSLPWIINSSSRAVKQKNISPLVSPISVWYSIYLPTFVTN